MKLFTLTHQGVVPGFSVQRLAGGRTGMLMGSRAAGCRWRALLVSNTDPPQVQNNKVLQADVLRSLPHGQRAVFFLTSESSQFGILLRVMTRVDGVAEAPAGCCDMHGRSQGRPGFLMHGQGPGSKRPIWVDSLVRLKPGNLLVVTFQGDPVRRLVGVVSGGRGDLELAIERL